jgi:hypothetical protein
MSEAVRVEGREHLFAFVGGALTAGTIVIAFLVAIGVRGGLSPVLEAIGIWPEDPGLEIPADLVAELAAKGAVIDNANNPTGARRHDTILVQPHEDLEYTLRPGVSINGYMIHSSRPLNLDPPVIYIESSAAISPALRTYLDENSRLSYTYTIDPDGFRQTLPATDAHQKILMVGDSGLFGIGVNDWETIASNLQRVVGESYRVVNAGVGGYDGDKAFRVARNLSEESDYSLLVYIAHCNDFDVSKNYSSAEKARSVLANFETLRDRFSEGIVVGLIPYLEYTGNDVLRQRGWRKHGRVESLDRLRREVREIARDSGFSFIDFADIADDIRREERSIFSAWSLYVDHGHLSPRGTQLLAGRIFDQHALAALHAATVHR